MDSYRKSSDSIYDQRFLDVDEHGLGVDSSRSEVYYDSGYGQTYKNNDRHGIGPVRFYDREAFTSDVNIQNFCKDIIRAENIKPAGYEQIIQLPDQAIKSVISARYKNTVSKLASGVYDPSLERQLSTDLELISQVVNSGKNLYEADFDVGILLGEDDRKNIIGVLENYEGYVNSSDLSSKSATLDSVARIKETANIQSEKMGYSSDGKTI